MRVTKKSRIRFCITILAVVASLGAAPSNAQDPRPGEPGHVPATPLRHQTEQHRGNGTIAPPERSDTLFLVDQGPGLDTGCVFNNQSPLVFDIPVDRAVGDVDELIAAGRLPRTVQLSMPAYDVDFDAVPGGGASPERNRVLINGNVVPGQFLDGANNVWRLNVFRIPTGWLRFPAPAASGSITPALNRVEIHIDVQNANQVWCTEIDWASLKLDKAPRPVVGVHGIFSDGGIWNNVWIPELDELGIPMRTLELGALDSIGNNAGKIALEVANTKRIWGVDKVDIVAHSKGGIDARQFVESNDSVEQLLQLGTPNGGSPLADLIQAGALVTVGLPGTIAINALAGPAGVQLTTGYMAAYNRSHGRNADVDYTSVAGKYTPNCPPLIPFCAPLNVFAFGITLGPGDGVVPVWSAHILPYTRDRTFDSSGLDFDATHIRLHSSLRLFGDYYTVLLADATPATPVRSKAALGQPPALVATGSAGGQIAANQVRTHAIPVDQNVPVLFTLLHPSGTLGLVLISPSGQRIDPAVAAADPGIVYEAGDILGGRAAMYGLPAAEVGVWTVEVSAGALAAPLTYAVQAQLQNPDLILAGPASSTAVSLGGQVVLAATLSDAGQPVTGAAVNARIGRPDGSLLDAVMRDDGIAPDTVANDGVYQVRVADHKLAGFQPVAFSASGVRAGGQAFSREIFHLLTVSAGQSSFTGAFSDAGEDTDGDGLFNHLAIRAEVDAGVAGSYRLYGELSDSQGNVHTAAQVVTLPAGRSAPALRFDGGEIFDNAVDGPYTVTTLRLAEDTPEGSLPVAELAVPLQTGAYLHTAFQHLPIRVSDSSSSTGIDTDGDSLFDLLTVTLQVALDDAGFYEWSGVLVDRNGNELGFASGSGTLNAGNNLLAFRFDAVPIGQSGVDGPYYLRDVLIIGAGNSAIVDQTFTTLPFRANQFEGYRGTPLPVTPVPLGGPLVWMLIALLLAGFGMRRLRGFGRARL